MDSLLQDLAVSPDAVLQMKDTTLQELGEGERD